MLFPLLSSRHPAVVSHTLMVLALCVSGAAESAMMLSKIGMKQFIVGNLNGAVQAG